MPQRRKRISLVADFGGDTAPEILFERKGLSGDSEQSGTQREEVAGATEDSLGEPSAYTLKIRGGVERDCYGKKAGKGALIQTELSATLGVSQDQTLFCIEGNGSRPSHKENGYVEGEVSYTLNATEHHAVCIENHPNDSRCKIREDGIVQTLSGRMGTGGNNVPMVMEQGSSWDGSQVAKGPGAVCTSIVRRLTPMECERLQGYPDGWTDIGEWTDSKGKKHKDADSPRYKALGNSIALPFWQWMAEKMVRYISGEPTMASLFDGISGFCLVYARVGCKPCWSSEIEEFPIAVAKKHFGDDEKGLKGDYEQYL